MMRFLIICGCAVGQLVAEGLVIQGEKGERDDAGKLSYLQLEWAVPKAEFSPGGPLYVDFQKQARRGESWWSARLRTSATKKLNQPHEEWSKSIRLRREDLIEIVKESLARLKAREPAARLKYLSLAYHLVLEHEADLHPRLKKVLAAQAGEVRGKHRGVMRKFHDAFLASKALPKTRTALIKVGIPIVEKDGARMEGDYYTPVDRELAATWKEAAALPDFGLSYPPSIVFVADLPTQTKAWTGCLDDLKTKYKVDAKLVSPFFQKVEASYPWYIVEREDGSLEDVFDGEVDEKDRQKIEFTAQVTSTHQGKHSMRHCDAVLQQNRIAFTIWGGLPAYLSELKVELQKDGRFQCVFDAESPASGPEMRWRIAKKKLVFQKKPTFKLGERLLAYIEVEFDEITVENGKKIHSSHKIEGYLKPVLGALE